MEQELPTDMDSQSLADVDHAQGSLTETTVLQSFSETIPSVESGPEEVPTEMSTQPVTGLEDAQPSSEVNPQCTATTPLSLLFATCMNPPVSTGTGPPLVADTNAPSFIIGVHAPNYDDDDFYEEDDFSDMDTPPSDVDGYGDDDDDGDDDVDDANSPYRADFTLQNLRVDVYPDPTRTYPTFHDYMNGLNQTSSSNANPPGFVEMATPFVSGMNSPFVTRMDLLTITGDTVSLTPLHQISQFIHNDQDISGSSENSEPSQQAERDLLSRDNSESSSQSNAETSQDIRESSSQESSSQENEPSQDTRNQEPENDDPYLSGEYVFDVSAVQQPISIREVDALSVMHSYTNVSWRNLFTNQNYPQFTQVYSQPVANASTQTSQFYGQSPQFYEQSSLTSPSQPQPSQAHSETTQDHSQSAQVHQEFLHVDSGNAEAEAKAQSTKSEDTKTESTTEPSPGSVEAMLQNAASSGEGYNAILELIQTHLGRSLTDVRTDVCEAIVRGTMPFDIVVEMGFIKRGGPLAHCVGVAFLNHSWKFVEDAAVTPRGAPIVVDLIRKNDFGLFKNFVIYCIDTNSYLTVAKVFELLIKADLFDALEHVFVTLWRCHGEPHSPPPMGCNYCIFEHVDLEYLSVLPECVRVDEKQAKKALEYFGKDDRVCIRYVVALLAMHISEWTLVVDILKEGAVRYLAGTTSAFMKALKDGAYDCCVLLIHAMITVCDNCDWGITSDFTAQIVAYCHPRPDVCQSMMEASRRLGFPGVEGLLAVWFRKIEEIRGALNNLHKSPDENAIFSFLNYVMQVSEAACLVIDWLKNAPDSVFPPRMMVWVMTQVCSCCENEKMIPAIPLAEAMISRSLDRCQLDDVLGIISGPHLTHCLRRFVARGHLRHCSDGMQMLLMMSLIKRSMLESIDVHFQPGTMDVLVSYVHCPTNHRQLDYDNLQLCVEAGLVHPVNPFPEARIGDLPLCADMTQLCFMYETGILTSQALLDLLEGVETYKIAVPQDEEQHCLDYLRQVAKNPRSLLGICSLHLFRSLGYGTAARKQRAQKWGLPSILLNKVLHQ